MDTELLKTFLEVKNTRHFGRAAENLCITQAAASARIKQLEAYFGVPLFVRKRNDIHPTAEGDRLTPHIETMLLAWSRAKQDIALETEHKNQLSIGATPGLWNYGYQAKLANIYDLMPTVALRSEAHNSEALIRLVLERALDIAILFDAPNIPELTIRSAGTLKLALYSTIPGATVKTAVSNNYIYVDWGTAFNIFHAKRFNDAIPAILHTTMASIAVEFMLSHPASAFLPAAMMSDKAYQHLKPISRSPVFEREISVIYRSGNENQPSIDYAASLLEKND